MRGLSETWSAPWNWPWMKMKLYPGIPCVDEPIIHHGIMEQRSPASSPPHGESYFPALTNFPKMAHSPL